MSPDHFGLFEKTRIRGKLDRIDRILGKIYSMIDAGKVDAARRKSRKLHSVYEKLLGIPGGSDAVSAELRSTMKRVDDFAAHRVEDPRGGGRLASAQDAGDDLDFDLDVDLSVGPTYVTRPVVAPVVLPGGSPWGWAHPGHAHPHPHWRPGPGPRARFHGLKLDIDEFELDELSIPRGPIQRTDLLDGQFGGIFGGLKLDINEFELDESSIPRGPIQRTDLLDGQFGAAFSGRPKTRRACLDRGMTWHGRQQGGYCDKKSSSSIFGGLKLDIDEFELDESSIPRGPVQRTDLLDGQFGGIFGPASLERQMDVLQRRIAHAQKVGDIDKVVQFRNELEKVNEQAQLVEAAISGAEELLTSSSAYSPTYYERTQAKVPRGSTHAGRPVTAQAPSVPASSPVEDSAEMD